MCAPLVARIGNSGSIIMELDHESCLKSKGWRPPNYLWYYIITYV